jgi:hypothetical protein
LPFEKVVNKIWSTSEIFQKLAKVNIRPIVKNSPKLVALGHPIFSNANAQVKPAVFI